MKEKQITVTREEMETIIYEAVLKERHMLFEMCLEDYSSLPSYIYATRDGKPVVIIPKVDWERFIDEISNSLGDLMIAREAIEKMKPVFNEYHEAYAQKHKFDFGEYMKMIMTSYDVEEFERVRDRFEEEYYRNLDEDGLER